MKKLQKHYYAGAIDRKTFKIESFKIEQELNAIKKDLKAERKKG